MRRILPLFLSLLFSAVLAAAQTAQPPQTARQALIEMFFGTAPNHLERHLPDDTRKVLKKMTSANGGNVLDEFSMFATMAKSGGGKLETFDAGPVLVEAESRDGSKVEITVEGDNLSGDEDDIELALHITKDGKEQILPIVPRFTFAMKSASDVWRLNEISVTVRVPLADPDFLKRIEDEHNQQNEQQAQAGISTIINAQDKYRASHGAYACSLQELSAKPKPGDSGSVLIAGGVFGDLAGGKHAGYVFAISGCDGTQYRVVAEPEVPESGERAFCSDESGTMRAARDGKATTCLGSGETVENSSGQVLVGIAGAPRNAESGALESPPPPKGANAAQVTRLRVSEKVMDGMVVARAEPAYPPQAATERIQGVVVLRAVIGKDGTVQNLRLVSGHPLLIPAAFDAVKQWKFRPFLLNGNPVEVDTQLSVNFTLK